MQQKKVAESSSRLPSAPSTPRKAGKKSGTNTPVRLDTRQLDLAALNLNIKEDEPLPEEPPPKITIAREKVLEEAKKASEGNGSKRGVSLIVIGNLFA